MDPTGIAEIAMDKHSKIWKTWLLFNLLFPLQSASLFGQSTHFLVTPDLRKASLTHTVFHRSTFRYSVAPFALDGERVSRNMLSSFGRPDDLPFAWKYNIFATLFWIANATEKGILPNTENARRLSRISSNAFPTWMNAALQNRLDAACERR